MTDARSSGQMVHAGIVAPNQRDFATLEAALHDWLHAKLRDARDLGLANFSYPRGAGLSHETILFDAFWTQGGAARQQGMVIRIKPTEHTVFQLDMFDQQY